MYCKLVQNNMNVSIPYAYYNAKPTADHLYITL